MSISEAISQYRLALKEGLKYYNAHIAAHENPYPEVLEDLMNENLAQLNDMLPAYSKVSSIVLVDKEFEKTPKRSIRRFLYS